MTCPNCGKLNADHASICAFCKTPLTTNKSNDNVSRLVGSLASNKSDDYLPQSRIKSTMRKSYSGEEIKTDGGAYTFCKNCGRKLLRGEKCPECDSLLIPPTNLGKTNEQAKHKPWLKIAAVIGMLILVIGSIPAITKQISKITHSSPQQTLYSEDLPKSSNQIPVNEPQNEPQEVLLSSLCDYIICVGYDYSGNKYELVANQTESSRGFEISVGVIKNNSWLYPLSTDFPFLEEDGLFHVSVPISFVGDDAKTGTSLLHPNRVVDKTYFIDSGAFLLECSREKEDIPGYYDKYFLIFSCGTLQCKRIDRSKTNLLYHYEEPTYVSGNVESYGKIYTDNGRMISYEETSGTFSGWAEDQVFRWDILDVKSLTTTTIASDVKGIMPRGVLAENLFFCSDKWFYNTNGQRTVDLTNYDINVWDSGDILFESGTCTFEVKNSLGTRFLITIDANGSQINEQPA